MKKQCAWCGSEMVGDPQAEPQLITHGICDGCRESLLSDLGTPLQQFIDSLPVPVLVAEEDVVVQAANTSARGLLGKTPEAIRGRLGGDVFDCAHAQLPEGCGRTIHCSGCTIRNTVTDTFSTGTPHVRVPATLKRGTVDDPENVQLYITTERVQGRVILKVEGLDP